jgi:hypothetical protein
MREIVANQDLVAYCGLYCGACGSYLRERCPGCHGNSKASWCKVRACCGEHHYTSCAECAEFPDPKRCVKFHNFFSRAIGFVMRSSRAGCIALIRSKGREAFAREMAARKRHSLPRKG